MSEPSTEIAVVTADLPAEPFITAMRVFRVTNHGGQVMYLTSLEKSLDGIKSALHHLEPMPESMTIELMGMDGTRVIFTKRQLALVRDQMVHLMEDHDAD